MGETMEDRQYYGTSADTTYNETLCYLTAIPLLIRYNKFKKIEVINTGPSTKLEYHYFPETNEY